MEEQQNKPNSTLKIIIGVLAILLIGSLVFINKISTDVEQANEELTVTMTEKDSVMKNLQELKATYDAAIAENTSMSDELVKERDKVVNLMSDINKSKGDASKYRSQYLKLESNLKVLMVENETLKKQNSTLTSQRDSTSVVLNEAKKANEVLLGQKDNLSETIKKGSKLSVVNAQAVAYQLKNSGKQIATDKASRANVLKISYTIAENQIAESGEIEYYIQVIDSKSNVIGDKQTISFDDKTLTYSFVSKVKYENKTITVSENLPGKNFAKGTYFVNIFDKNELVTKTSISLR